LLDRLAADERFPLDRAALDALLADRLTFTGAAADQVAAVVTRVEEVVRAHPDAAAYSPGALLRGRVGARSSKTGAGAPVGRRVQEGTWPLAAALPVGACSTGFCSFSGSLLDCSARSSRRRRAMSEMMARPKARTSTAMTARVVSAVPMD